MKLLFFYPRQWRERYGDELEALMEDTPAGTFDVLKGAIAMRVKYLSGWAILVACAVTGLLTGFGYSYLIPERWESTALLQLTPQGVLAADVGPQQAYDLAVAQNELMGRIRAASSSADVLIVPTPWPLLTAGYVPKLTFTVRYRHGDPAQAKALIDAEIEGIRTMKRAGSDIAVTQAPQLRWRPRPGQRVRFAALGMMVWLVVGMGTALVRGIARADGMQTA